MSDVPQVSRRREVPLQKVLDAAHRYSRWAAWGGGFLFIGVAFLITAEIILRKVFNLSIGGADELTGYALAAAGAWSFGYAVIERCHIRVDSFYGLLPLRVRAVLDILALAAMLLFFSLVLYFGFVMFQESVRLVSRSRTGLSVILAVPQSVWLAGLLVSAVVTTIVLVASAIALARGDARAVAAIAGSRTAKEDLEDELSSLEQRHRAEVDAQPRSHPGGAG